jgi:hypothetical protein
MKWTKNINVAAAKIWHGGGCHKHNGGKDLAWWWLSQRHYEIVE